MKHFFNGMLIALALVLALVMGVAAMAENAGPETPELPAIDDTAPEQPADDAPADDAATDDTALRQALDAYRAAKQSGRQAEIEAEIEGYVEAGTLTREQADLILKYYKEQQALKDGTCPNCGYQFQNGGFGKGGRGMMGGNGMGGRMNGGKAGRRGMFNQQQPSMQQPADGQTNGTSYLPETQVLPNVGGVEGI